MALLWLDRDGWKMRSPFWKSGSGGLLAGLELEMAQRAVQESRVRRVIFMC